MWGLILNQSRSVGSPVFLSLLYHPFFVLSQPPYSATVNIVNVVEHSSSKFICPNQRYMCYIHLRMTKKIWKECLASNSYQAHIHEDHGPQFR